MTSLVAGKLNKTCVYGFDTLENIEKKVIVERLTMFGGDPNKTAKSLGIGRATLYRKMEELRKELENGSEETNL